mgnify:CR=1 FL=1
MKSASKLGGAWTYYLKKRLDAERFYKRRFIEATTAEVYRDNDGTGYECFLPKYKKSGCVVEFAQDLKLKNQTKDPRGIIIWQRVDETGHTRVEVRIPATELKPLLQGIAEQFPDMWETFLDCACEAKIQHNQVSKSGESSEA